MRQLSRPSEWALLLLRYAAAFTMVTALSLTWWRIAAFLLGLHLWHATLDFKRRGGYAE